MTTATTERKTRIIGFASASRVLAPLLLLFALLVPGANLSAAQHAPYSTASAGLGAGRGYGGLPLRFEPNVGQADASVLYLAHGAAYTLFLTRRGAILSFAAIHPMEKAPSRRSLHALGNRSATLSLSFAGASSLPRVQPEQKRAGIANYFIGSDPKGWHTDIPTYARVTYHGIYPGIDLVFYGRAGQFEYDWLIHPHANPAVIAMTIGGAKSVYLDRSGTLLLGTSVGVIRQRAPNTYQLQGTQRVAVHGAYRLAGSTRVGFRLARYDHTQPLVIDPVLAYGTYLGGDASADGVTIDSSGDAYLTGGVTGLIPTRNPYQPARAGDFDAFITKFNPSGSDLVYSTYLGGAKYDYGNAIVVDGSGSAYIAGATQSSDFPGLSGVVSLPYRFAAFVVKLSPTGDKIVYAHGDPSADPISGNGIAVDGAGDAYYCLYVWRPTGSALTTFALVNELAPNGSLIHGQALSGSSGGAWAFGIALDGRGNVYVAGYTDSPDFFTLKALQPGIGGKKDAFLAKLDASDLTPKYITLLGGAGDDYAWGVAVGASGNVYVAGQTSSANFPTASPLQSSLAGKQDGFVAEINAAGTALLYSTYLGGHETSVEDLYAIAVDGAGDAYVTGETTAADYPTVNALPSSSSFKGDAAMVTEIAAGGRSLIYSTFLGGVGASAGYAIFVNTAGSVYVAGDTNSTDFPTSPSAYQHGFLGKLSAFAVILATLPATPHILVSSSKITSGNKLKVTVVTSPDADVTITVQAKSGKTILVHAVATGTADGAGKLTKYIKITYNPSKQVKARVTVVAKNAGGSRANSTNITILHHR
jgi:Beta-propeller repeat